MSETTEPYGLGDDDLATLETAYREDLFAGKIVLVSGGGGAIGRATAWLLARLGAHVIVTGRKSEKLAAVCDGLTARGLSGEGHTVDIRDPDAASALFEDVWARHGRLDLLINSAGGQFPQAAIDFSTKGWNAVIDTNLNGTWHMMQAAAPAMAPARTTGQHRQHRRRHDRWFVRRRAFRRGTRRRDPSCQKMLPWNGRQTKSGSIAWRRAPLKAKPGQSIHRKQGPATPAPTQCCAPAVPGMSPRPVSTSGGRVAPS